MSKRSRFLLILVILGICFAFLWPSISWYVYTPKEVQTLALGSLEKIKDYATAMASEDVKTLKASANAGSETVLDAQLAWLEKAAKKNYKQMDETVPSPMTAVDVLSSFYNEQELSTVIQQHYRDEILAAKKRYQNSVKLGLDLSGGMNIIVKADLDTAVASQGDSVTTDNIAQFKADAMTQAVETLTSRIDRFGLTSPVIRQQGEDRIYIEIPGAAEAESINTIIMGKGILNFRLVDSEATQAFQSYYASNAATAFTASGALSDPSVIPEDCEVMGLYTKDDYGLDERVGYLVVKKTVVLDGQHIQSAQVSSSNLTNQPEVDFVLDSEGAGIFADFTASHIGENLAIVSDNQVKSNARINDAIPGGRVAITGFNLEEAQNLQKVLQTAWLNVPLSVESQQVIGASLGNQAIKQGLLALVIGLLAVMLFMLIYYKGAGFNAVVAQLLNLYILFSILSAFNLTLTLSSIAGIVLTLAMAVDANVIIFERIKEELRAGKSRSASISAGFDNAFWAIMDSNITTFIAAIFLSQLGTGSIQGFAVSLAIGVVSSVFTALFVSRLIFDFNTEVVGHQNVSISWRIK